jgi:hypothetical protein
MPGRGFAAGVSARTSTLARSLFIVYTSAALTELELGMLYPNWGRNARWVPVLCALCLGACEGPLELGAAEAGGQSLQAGGDPMRAGGQSLQPGNQPVQAGGQPLQPGNQPVQPGNQPVQAGGQPLPAGAALVAEHPGTATGPRAVPANGTVGLDWPRAPGATGYRVYWSTSPGIVPGLSAHIDTVEAALVHRGLTNGARYSYVVAALGPEGEGPPSAEVSAIPGGEWVLEALGAGDFDDVLTGNRVARVPLERRVHVLLYAEGYRQDELSVFGGEAGQDGSRDSDVARWVDEVFALEPYRSLRSAFVIWSLPRASAAHLGQGDTAFRVRVNDGGVASVKESARPMWDALDGAGGDAFPFPPGIGSNNHVPVFLLYDPMRGQAGWSGLSIGLSNPSNHAQSLRCAFGIDHAHEFTHAFASLRDEYLENRNGPPRAGETCNVSPVNRCSELPWAHLLAGNGINPAADLVGAFGTPERGFHPELHCLMNGMHDNGEYYCPADAAGRHPGLGLRVRRMCNFCREMTAFRVFERTGLLPESSGFARWKNEYRPRFFARFGFDVPATVPQVVQCPNQAQARPVFEACVP